MSPDRCFVVLAFPDRETLDAYWSATGGLATEAFKHGADGAALGPLSHVRELFDGPPFDEEEQL